MAKISDEAYKQLQYILEEQYGQSFAIEDVREIGDGLVEFYKLLADLSKEFE